MFRVFFFLVNVRMNFFYSICNYIVVAAFACDSVIDFRVHACFLITDELRPSRSPVYGPATIQAVCFPEQSKNGGTQLCDYYVILEIQLLYN